MYIDRERIRGAWEGRISGCMLGKAVEMLSMTKGREALLMYLEKAGALPLRDYVPLIDDGMAGGIDRRCCRGFIGRCEPDDDINYTVLALMMMERHGLGLTTADVARAWLRFLPAGAVFTAERAAYCKLLEKADNAFLFGGEPKFDLSECAANQYSEWIGAQIRADLYGWVCPGRPQLAAKLARRDASLSHTGEGIHGAVFIAALAAAIPASESFHPAVDAALDQIPSSSAAAEAVRLGRKAAGSTDALERLLERYAQMSPVHTVNNLSIVVWGLLSGADDFSRAVGDAVAAGWDTDCNGATVGGLWGLSGRPIPGHWTEPWRGRVAVGIAGVGELSVRELVDRTIAVASAISRQTENAPLAP